MMDSLIAAVAGGLVLGLASSLHCACMCGGIASGFTFLAGPSASPSERARMILTLQMGRIGVYALVGGVSAGTAAVLLDPFASATNYRLLQWFGAGVLMWVGFTMAGVLPRLQLAGEGFASVTTLPQRWLGSLRKHRVLFPVTMGASWALTPCPMVYAALFSATLTGAFATGSAWMIGFGAGTVPAVLCATFGVSQLAQYGRSASLHFAAGLAIAGLGLMTVLLEWPAFGLLCIRP